MSDRQGLTKKGGRIAVELYRKIIDEAASFAIVVNLFGRGEALLHPGLPELIRYARLKRLNIRLETNATLLTPSKSEELIRSGLDFISFSMDGYTKETYESIRVGGRFEENVQNILLFLEIKKKLGAGKPFASIQFINTTRFLEGSSRADELRFKERFSRLPVNAYRYVTPHRYTGEIEQAVTGTRWGYVRERPSRMPFVALRYTPCPYPWFSTHILWDGTVTPCCMDFHARYILGNARESTLLEIWNGEAMRHLRRNIAAGSYQSISLCSGCDLLHQMTFMGLSTKNIRGFKIFLQENIFCR